MADQDGVQSPHEKPKAGKKAVPLAKVLQESPQPAPRMTEALFVEELLTLFKRGEDAGLSPTNITIRVCFKRGVSMLDGFLANVETNLGSGTGKKG